LSIAIAMLGACGNPAKEMYQKPIDQRQKAQNLQQDVDQIKSTVEQQEKSLKGSQKSP
jgi:hypothetical protein